MPRDAVPPALKTGGLTAKTKSEPTVELKAPAKADVTKRHAAASTPAAQPSSAGKPKATRGQRATRTPKPAKGPIAALDVGSSKIACFIADQQEDGDLRVLGVGHQRSRGIRTGQVCNMEEVEHAILATVDAAERMSGKRIENVLLNVSAGRPVSTVVGVEMAVGGKEIRDAQVAKLLGFGRSHHVSRERELIHCIPLGYTVDGHDGTLDPRGMYGQNLGVTIHLVSALSNPLRNVETALGRCQLDVEDRVVSGYAAGLACLVDDEKDMGVTVIDMGGGTTSFAVFLEGHVIHTEILPLGGMHVTNDIARVLGTPVAGAERLKTVHGGAIAAPRDDREILRVPLVGEEDDACANEISRKTLIDIIAPRIEETFEMVRERLQSAGLDKVGGRVLVLTGGGSQLDGARDLAETILDRQVRLGKPLRIQGLPSSAMNPAFSVCAGLLRYGLQHQVATPDPGPASDRIGPAKGRWGKALQWLKENF